MTSSEAFVQFCANLQADNLTVVSERIEQIVGELHRHFQEEATPAEPGVPIGSYGRGTGLAGVSPYEVAFALPGKDSPRHQALQEDGPLRLLEAVREALRKTSPAAEVSADGQTVALPYPDGVVIKVRPCFRESHGGLTCPDATGDGTWKKLDPQREIDALAKLDHERNHNLKRLCRMARAWRTKWKVPMKGLLIDTLAYQFMEANPDYADRSYSFYDWMCQGFFQFLEDQDEKQAYWRAPGSNHLVYRTGSFKSMAAQCRALVNEAIDFDEAGKQWPRNYRWRHIFGTGFPE